MALFVVPLVLPVVGCGEAAKDVSESPKDTILGTPDTYTADSVANLSPDAPGPGCDAGPPPAECCSSDEECGADRICISPAPGEPLACHPALEEDRCYFDADCPEWHACYHQRVCTCGANCSGYAGRCYPVGDCCTGDAECPDGLRCVGAGGAEAMCLLPPADGGCWDDSDCPGAEDSCVFPSICGCGNCTLPNKPGTCRPPPFASTQAECVAKFSGCECSPGCVDAPQTIILYPADAGEFAAAAEPPQALLDIALGWYECSACDCTESLRIYQDWSGEFVDIEVDAFCSEFLGWNGECGQCIGQWVSGGS